VLRLASESSNAAASCLLLLRHHKMVAVCPPALVLSCWHSLALWPLPHTVAGREAQEDGREVQEEGREARRQQWAKAEEGREGGDGDALTR
jgi:hypothetical protein